MASLLISALHQGGVECAWRRAGTPQELEAALADGPWDVVLADAALPDIDLARSLDTLAPDERDIPVIIVSPSNTLRSVVDMVKRGVGDFVSMFELERLPASVESALRECDQRRQHRLHHEEMRRRANHDLLTSLPNRHLFDDRLDRALKRARRSDTTFSLLFIDLDHFKTVNDTLGHGAGDELLRGVAERLRDCVRESDTVARLGGDEFTILVEDATESNAGETVARKALDALSLPFHIAGAELYVSASVGIADFPADGDDAETLLECADTAMYRVKSGGRNGYHLYTPNADGKDQTPPPRPVIPLAARRALRQRPSWHIAGPALAAALLIGWFAHSALAPEPTPPLAELEPLRLPADSEGSESIDLDEDLDMETAAGGPCAICMKR